MNTLVSFFKNNNARIGQTLSLIGTFCAVRGWISMQTLELLGMIMVIWVGGSWAQGAKNKFKPPAQ